ncbi:hypothetical protein SAMN04515675_6116 [Pseudomonas costantinii]|uniref:DUF1983 domain-containing protein n=2 Tax=Pseudomonas costantinii TaxID=168469 RepID=A0A1S2UHQ9_9PSED|nr:hypothetical protein BFL40_27565 [Pseudomonas costantinii]SEE53904.1 hypothetical protein SAMN04515675_6116 [Pseudomonas costantinii]
MSGFIQSHDYVPGMSGWIFNKDTGEFEIYSSSGNMSTDAQLITVTAGDWSDYDLPANALERLAFITAELDKIPADCRGGAEFTTEDISFDRDGSDVRTTLTYVRQETPDEVMARIEKGQLSVRINGLGGANFSIYHDGQLRVQFGILSEPGPFIVAGGKVYLRKEVIDKTSNAFS